jgi:hypothetical protein
MYQPVMPQLHLVAAATVAERHADADRARGIARPGSVDRPVLALLRRAASSGRADGPGRLLRFPDRTPPAPEAA